MADLKTYWLSFRVKEDTTGQDRRGALYEYIEEISGEYWDSTTSFLIFDSDRTILQICAGLSKKLDVNSDQFVIRYLNQSTGRYWGNIKEAAKLKRLTGFTRYP